MVEDTDVILATLDATHATLENRTKEHAAPETESAQSTMSSSSEVALIARASNQTESSSAILHRAAEQQLKLAQMIPDNEIRAEMLAEAKQQEERAHNTSGSRSVVNTSTKQCCTDAVPARAVLRRDAKGLFKLVLKEGSEGVYIGRLHASDAEGDERALLCEGDVILSINGLQPQSMKFEDLKQYVRDCPGALHIEVDRAAINKVTSGNEATKQEGQHALVGSSAPFRSSVGESHQFADHPGEDVLASVKHGLEQVGQKWEELVESREVQEFKEKAERTTAQLGMQVLQH